MSGGLIPAGYVGLFRSCPGFSFFLIPLGTTLFFPEDCTRERLFRPSKPCLGVTHADFPRDEDWVNPVKTSRSFLNPYLLLFRRLNRKSFFFMTS